MIALRSRCQMTWTGDPVIARVSRTPGDSNGDRSNEVQLISDGDQLEPGYAAYLSASDERRSDEAGQNIVYLDAKIRYLEEGDVVCVVPKVGELSVLYRKNSASNVIFTTERCNSDCVMCSQPPKDIDDSHLIDRYLQAIPLMDPKTPELGITGGEPTLLGPDLFRLIDACRHHLPETALHMLSNGRLFNYLSLAERLASVQHPDLMVGIPIYADTASRHDFVVQAAGAFDQTLRGIMNLKRCGVLVELRVVIHQLTVERLPQLCQFIARNLPMVDHVALMGLEPIGYVPMNLAALWIDPLDYQAELLQGVRTLAAAGLRVSIYNHQLCVLDRELWAYAGQSISDWKNDFAEECENCGVRNACGGFFGHSTRCRSRGIRAVSEPSPAMSL